MPTLLTSLVAQARLTLLEESFDTGTPSTSFWSDQELLDILDLGVKDLWGAILDVHGEHYMTVDTLNVTLPAGTSQLAGVPADVFRVLLIEPRDTTSNGQHTSVQFVPRKYNSLEFRAARSQVAIDPQGGSVIFYTVSGVGSPVAAPVIYTAPPVSATMKIRLVYCPTITTAGGMNPIPGESDNALKSWCVAWARAKEREDRSPDPNWLATYATEKGNLLTRITPRQEQEPDVVEDLFGGI